MPQQRHPLRDAHTDITAARVVPDTAQTRSSAYRLAFTDEDFMCRDELRPVRLQLELLKTEMLLDEANIGSMLVIYGSARIPEADGADALIAAATDERSKIIAERMVSHILTGD